MQPQRSKLSHVSPDTDRACDLRSLSPVYVVSFRDEEQSEVVPRVGTERFSCDSTAVPESSAPGEGVMRPTVCDEKINSDMIRRRHVQYVSGQMSHKLFGVQ